MFELEKNTQNNQPNTTDMAHKHHASITPDMIDWSVVGGSNSNFTTHKLNKVSSSRIEVKQTIGNMIFYFIFLLSGIIWLIFCAVDVETSRLYSLGGLPFILIGILPFYKPKTGVFDTRVGWFWFGSRKITDSNDIQNLKKKCQLSNIAAIQVIKEIVISDDDNYPCYELNLVMNNSRRHNIMRHGGTDMLSDAKMLAHFLNVPCFDNC